MTTTAVVGFADLLRDLRHLDARAASDLADWLAWLEAANKADRTLYAYMRTYGWEASLAEDVLALVAVARAADVPLFRACITEPRCGDCVGCRLDSSLARLDGAR